MTNARVVHWAHQGGAREGPSNTLLAFWRAVELRDPDLGFEFDVHVTADAAPVLVVIHDRTLERTTDGHGRVRRHLRSDLRRLNAAWWWHPGAVDDHSGRATHPLRSGTPDADVGIPTLAAVLGLWQTVEPRPPVTIEVKSWRAVRPLLVALRSYDAGERSLITVTSFFDPIVWWLRLRMWRDETDEARFVGLAPGAGYMFVFWALAALGVPPRASRYTRLQLPIRKGLTFATPRLVRSAQRVRVRASARTAPGQRVRVDVWTVDDEQEMTDLQLRLGVDGIMTDRPSVLRSSARGMDGGGGPGEDVDVLVETPRE